MMNILQGMMLVFGIAAVLYSSREFRAKFNGWLGEIVLHRLLKEKLDKRQYIVLHNIMLPTAEGTTTQIDHIIVSPWGLFVIETKSFSGYIYGKAGEMRWTAKYHPKQKGYLFQNPLRQNFKHIAVLSERLGIEREYFKTIIAFAGTAHFGKEMPSEVMLFRDVPGYIRKNSTNVIILQEQIQEIADAIIAWQKTLTKSQKSAHVRNLQKVHSENRKIQDAAKERKNNVSQSGDSGDFQEPSTAPLCIKCSIPMVLRTRKEDSGKFWGCPHYPKCHYIVNIDTQHDIGR